MRMIGISQGRSQEGVSTSALEPQGRLRIPDKKLVKTLIVAFAIAIVTMKIAPRMGNTAPQTVLGQLFILFIILARQKRLYIARGRFIWFTVLIVAASIADMISADVAELPSFTFVVVIYFTYTLEMRVSRETYFSYLRKFQYLGMIAAGLVYMDWIAQILHLGMPNMERFIPKNWLFFNYVYIQPLQWGAHYMKPNGFFFLEASFISQFLAFALIFEVCFFRRLPYLMVLGSGLLATFGGTGMLLVALCSPFMAFYLRPKMIPLLVIVAVVSGLVAAQLGLLQNIEKRSTEFSQQGSSGNMRFVQQAVIVQEIIEGDAKSAMFGHGSGVMQRGLNVLFTPLTKISYEYGLIVAAIWLSFMILCIFGRGVPLVVSWMMFVDHLLLNGSLLVPIVNYYVVMFVTLFRVDAPMRPGPLVFAPMFDRAKGRLPSVAQTEMGG